MTAFRTARPVALLAVAVAATAAFGTAVVRRHDSVVRYADARAMAERIGCLDTFTDLPAFAGVTSAGRCTVGGAVVELRVFASTDAAFAWQDGSNHGHGRAVPSVVGDGWVAQTTDRGVSGRVAEALTAR